MPLGEMGEGCGGDGIFKEINRLIGSWLHSIALSIVKDPGVDGKCVCADFVFVLICFDETFSWRGGCK